jgi:hypothetical protein
VKNLLRSIPPRGVAWCLIVVASASLFVSAHTAVEIHNTLSAIDARIARTFNPEPCR